ncbi:retrovirus-related pol polyprotein from transposon TNT 1-94 [Tanacetum coccineum]
MSQHLKRQGGSSSRSHTLRPLKPFPPCKHYGFNDHQSDNCVNYPTCEICGNYDHETKVHNRIISLRRGIKPRNPQQVTKNCKTYGSNVDTTTDHNNIEWFRRGEALQAKKCDIRKPIWYLDNGCSRHMTGVKSYLHKYVEKSSPKVVFGDDSTCTTEGYGFIKCNGIFDEKRGIIFNSNKEVVMIALRIRDVNNIIVNFCDEKRISQNFSSPYTLEQNCVAERKNRILIEATRTMLLGFVFSKQYWTKAIVDACYTQNRYPPDEYLHPYEPSQRYQVDSNDVQYIEPYEKPEPVITEVDASLDQNDQADQTYQMDQNDLNDQNDHPVQIDEILTNDQLEH